MGRAAIIKMNILPKFIFLFQNLPIISNEKYFEQWQKELSQFLWQGKKARVKWKILTDDKNRGGWALPNLKLYYYSSCLNWIEEWIRLDNERLLCLEGYNLRYGFHGYMWYNKLKADKNFDHHFVRRSLLKVWSKIKNKFYKEIPLWVSPQEAFLYRTKTKNEKWVKYKDILNKECNNEYCMKSMTQIQNELPKINWFVYNQLTLQFKKDHREFGLSKSNNELDDIFIKKDKAHITKFYKILKKIDLEQEVVKHTMVRWAIDIGRTIQLETWEKSWKDTNKFTLCQNLKENYFKMLYRWYMTPTKINLIYKSGKRNCWKCNKTEGNHYHCWWTCHKAKEYWKRIQQMMNEILQVEIPLKPELFLLNMIGIALNKKIEKYTKIILYMVTSARILYATYWKKPQTPTNEEWLIKLRENMDMDILTKIMKNESPNEVENDWKCLKEYGKITGWNLS